MTNAYNWFLGTFRHPPSLDSICADLFSVAGTAANGPNEVAGNRTRTGAAENVSADAEWGDFGGTDGTEFGTEDFCLASAPGFQDEVR